MDRPSVWPPETLPRTKRMGGMGVLVLHKYYEIIVLQQILDWYHGVTPKLCVPLEKFLSGQNLARVPWVPREHRGVVRIYLTCYYTRP